VVELEWIGRDLLAVLEPQTTGAVWTAELANGLYLARILDPERHPLHQADVRPLDTAGDPSTLRADEVTTKIPAQVRFSTILHGYVTTPRGYSGHD
jgi:hypothetical protein